MLEIANELLGVVHEHELNILRNQKQTLQFSEISRWIDDLRQNILDIEVNLFADENDNGDTGSVNVSQRLDENAKLCFKISNAVKRLQEDLDKPKQQNDDTEKEDGLANLVRSTQFGSIKTAYIDAYWKYNAVVRRYKDKINDKRLVVSPSEDLTTLPPPSGNDDDGNTTDPMLTDQTFATVDETRGTLDAVVDRHQELVSMEQSLLEMRDLFVMFSTLGTDNGKMLNLAEGHVQVALEHVVTAAKDVKEGRKYYTRIFLVVLVKLILIAVFIAVQLNL
ncbi:syntaxin-1B-like [Ochlerotatus camptorhynchus]|uniref:syntaxin-1B-like n=1 Tax=Ochlerotatus camptorhynchus TaxID=644619 RepID=UPI0031D1A41D